MFSFAADRQQANEFGRLQAGAESHSLRTHKQSEIPPRFSEGKQVERKDASKGGGPCGATSTNPALVNHVSLEPEEGHSPQLAGIGNDAPVQRGLQGGSNHFL